MRRVVRGTYLVWRRRSSKDMTMADGKSLLEPPPLRPHSPYLPFIKNPAPSAPPASSSDTAQKMSVPRSGTRDVAKHANVTACAATVFSISMAPRPHTSPSTTLASNGGTFHAPSFTGTTSTCPGPSMTRGPSPPPPRYSAMRLGRLGRWGGWWI